MKLGGVLSVAWQFQLSVISRLSIGTQFWVFTCALVVCSVLLCTCFVGLVVGTLCWGELGGGDLCGEEHAPFWEARRGPRELRTVARGCAPRAGWPTTRRGAAWGTLGGWTRPRTSAIVEQRTHMTTPISQPRRARRAASVALPVGAALAAAALAVTDNGTEAERAE